MHDERSRGDDSLRRNRESAFGNRQECPFQERTTAGSRDGARARRLSHKSTGKNAYSTSACRHSKSFAEFLLQICGATATRVHQLIFGERFLLKFRSTRVKIFACSILPPSRSTRVRMCAECSRSAISSSAVRC